MRRQKRLLHRRKEERKKDDVDIEEDKDNSEDKIRRMKFML